MVASFYHASTQCQQTRDKGGWVKAMARFGGSSTTPDRCFNSQQTEANVSGSGRGITRTHSRGAWTIGFGFQVSDRFVSVVPEFSADTAVMATIAPVSGGTNPQNKLRVRTCDAREALVDSAFIVIVY